MNVPYLNLIPNARNHAKPQERNELMCPMGCVEQTLSHWFMSNSCSGHSRIHHVWQKLTWFWSFENFPNADTNVCASQPTNFHKNPTLVRGLYEFHMTLPNSIGSFCIVLMIISNWPLICLSSEFWIFISTKEKLILMFIPFSFKQVRTLAKCCKASPWLSNSAPPRTISIIWWAFIRPVPRNSPCCRWPRAAARRRWRKPAAVVVHAAKKKRITMMESGLTSHQQLSAFCISHCCVACGQIRCQSFLSQACCQLLTFSFILVFVCLVYNYFTQKTNFPSEFFSFAHHLHRRRKAQCSTPRKQQQISK